MFIELMNRTIDEWIDYIVLKNIDPDKDWENRGYSVRLHEYLEHYPIQKPRSKGQER